MEPAGPAGDKITVFTTRVDTIYGATSLQLAPQHPVVTDLIANDPELLSKVEDLIAEQRKAKEVGDIGAIEKHGVFTDRYALNPFNGEKVPIWVANYVLMDYGTGAIMSVPAHDERDYEFAKKYGLDIRVVILPRREEDPPPEGQPDEPVLPFTDENSLVINSGEFSGLPCQEAIVKMSKYAEEHGFGKATVTFRLKDWGISRQRYWGTPIPMIYCEKCGIVPVPEDQLPVISARQRGHHADWRIAADPCAGVREREVSRSAEARRAARPTPWTPSSIRPGTSTATPIRGSTPRRSTAIRSPTGFRLISTSAASSTPFCT